MVLAAAGQVDFPRLVQLAETKCGHWPPRPATRVTAPSPDNSAFQVIPNDVASLQYVVQIANGPSASDPYRHAARVLSTVVGDDTGSRLFWKLIDTGRAECAVMSSCEYQGTGIFMSLLCGTPDDTKDNLQVLHDTLREVEAEGVTADELTQAQNKICSHVVLQSERPTNRLFSVGDSWIQRGTYSSVRETIRKYQAVTCRDVRHVLDQYPLTQHTTVAVGPLRELHRPG